MKKKVSARQMRAMQAAAGGRSTIGIPREVGREFVRAKAKAKKKRAKKSRGRG